MASLLKKRAIGLPFAVSGSMHRAAIYTVATINFVTNAVEFHQID